MLYSTWINPLWDMKDVCHNFLWMGIMGSIFITLEKSVWHMFNPLWDFGTYYEQNNFLICFLGSLYVQCRVKNQKLC